MPFYLRSAVENSLNLSPRLSFCFWLTSLSAGEPGMLLLSFSML
ncbi:hypothetical protein [Mixta intestinalis]|nr:hypothetical protein [Mixta intestinalis]